MSDAGSVGVVRRAAEALGRRLDLAGDRIAELAIVSTELGTNLHKYATGGLVR